MKKKIIKISIFLTSLVVLCGYLSKEKYEQNNETLAIFLNEERIESIPSKEEYSFDKAICMVNGTITEEVKVAWDNEEWAPILYDLKEHSTKCNLYFKEKTFSDAIKECDDTAANCFVQNIHFNDTELVYDYTEDNNVRYIGADPHNYVRFNDELWRIVGVFNNILDENGNYETRLKIVRSSPIGFYSWDNKIAGNGSSTSSYGSNNWSDATLKDLLNTGAYWNQTTGDCPYGTDGATIFCDFTTNGLNSEAKALIDTAVWNLGGHSSYKGVVASLFYEKERSTEVVLGHDVTWTGKVALLYPSDYAFATNGGNTTNRDICLQTAVYDWNKYDDCFTNNWLYYSESSQWSLMPYTGYDSNTFFINTYVSANPSASRFAVFPSLYLDANVRITDGDGSTDHPFILSIE